MTEIAPAEKEIYILGSKVNDVSLTETLATIGQLFKENKKGYVVTPNPEICLAAYKDKNLRRIIRDAFLAIPDGFGLKLGARIFGCRLRNITTGVDLTLKLLEFAEQNNYSVLFFEGIPKIGEQTLGITRLKYPKLKIKYLDPGKVDLQGNCENANLVEEINNFQPDIIFVNFGAPKQEYFMAKNLGALNTKLMLGVGGSLDFLANQVKRAPKQWRQIGLEWLWRLIHEPWRWKRILKAVIIFPLACVRFKIGLMFSYRNNVVGFIINKDKKIFLAKHARYADDWKLPQGGAKNAKTETEYKDAIFKEMKQELGTDKFKALKMIKKCYHYNWPNKTSAFDHFKGQVQTLFLLQFTGEDEDIKLDLNEHSEYKWVTKDEILSLAALVRKDIIKIGLTSFKDYL